jgi:polyhydroxyalkanoate synthesis regulator phasin
MTANELAEIADSLVNELPIREWVNDEPKNIMSDIADMLRQQAQEIADLKIANQDLKYQLIQKSGELILADFDIKDLEKEIEALKSKVQYWKAREK